MCNIWLVDFPNHVSGGLTEALDLDPEIICKNISRATWFANGSYNSLYIDKINTLVFVYIHDLETNMDVFFESTKLGAEHCKFIAAIPENDFSATRSLFLAGFDDVITIPVTASEIKIIIERFSQSSISDVENPIYELTRLEAEQYFNEKLLGFLTSGQYISVLQSTRLADLISLDKYRQYHILSFKVKLSAADYLSKNFQHFNTQLLYVLSQHLDDVYSADNYNFFYIDAIIEHRLCVLFYSKNLIGSASGIKALIESLQMEFFIHTGYKFIAGLSSEYFVLGNTSKSYAQAVNAINQAFYSNTISDSVIVYDPGNIPAPIPDAIKLKETMENAKSSSDISEFGGVFSGISALFFDQNIETDYAKKYFITLFNQWVFDSLSIHDSIKVKMYYEHNIDDAINMMENISLIQDFFNQLIDEITINSDEQSESNQTVTKIKMYLSSNYHTQLNLSQVAEIIHINPNYMSELFKKHTGVGFYDYLTQIRMLNAKALLVNTDKRIYEIGIEVGYAEAVSFNRAFKRIEGTSPQQYRKSLSTHRKFSE